MFMCRRPRDELRKKNDDDDDDDYRNVFNKLPEFGYTRPALNGVNLVFGREIITRFIITCPGINNYTRLRVVSKLNNYKTLQCFSAINSKICALYFAFILYEAFEFSNM